MNETPMSEVPGHSYAAPDHCAWTDPMCPEPMEKGSMYCRPHKIAARSDILRNVARRFFRMIADVAEDDELVLERTQAAMQMIALLSTSNYPEQLVTAAKLGVREMEARAHPQQLAVGTAVEDIKAGGTGTIRLDGPTPPEQGYRPGRVENVHTFLRLLRGSPQSEPFVARALGTELAMLSAADLQAVLSETRQPMATVPELPAPVGFIVAGPSTPDRLHEDGSRKLEVDWDGVVFQRVNVEARRSLIDCRSASYADWQLHALVPMPDEVVFGDELNEARAEIQRRMEDGLG